METCCIKETISAREFLPNTPYENEFDLTQFPRALDVADNFQEYRIKRVEFLYTPNFDTYVPGSVAPASVPYLWSKRLVVPAPTAYTLDFLKTMGAKPKRFDDKTIREVYRPNILQTAALQNGAAANLVRPIMSPWLSTHQQDGAMDNTAHFTHNFWGQQDITPTPAQQLGSIQVNVYFEFRKPWDLSTVGKDTEGVAKKAVI